VVNGLRLSVLLGSLAGTACASIFGVGELSAGGDDYGGAAAGGSSGSLAAAGAKAPAGSGAGGTAAAGKGGATTSAGKGGMAAASGVEGTITSAGAAGRGSDQQEPPPSCADLPTICGSSPSSSHDCCASYEVAGGTFLRSYDALPEGGWDDDSSPATISRFRLDAYEVTVGRFRRFVAEYPGRAPAGAGKNAANASDLGWNTAWNALLPRDRESLSRALATCGSADAVESSLSTWTAMPDANEALPINCLTWFEAFAFCAWDGGRLPSEAEWNYAAAGGAEARVYPWPSAEPTDVDPSYAVYQSAMVNANVGSKTLGNGRFGQADLAGSVWEWNVDWYREPYSVPCNDCAELAADVDGAGRVLRGGAYYNQPQYLRVAARGNAQPSTRDPGYGVRCARE
jgi:formylglycine-generating enzyme